MIRVPVSLLEENIDRVVDSVVRNVSAGRGAVPDLDAEGMGAPGGIRSDSEDGKSANEDAARETLADLYGHVAHALRALDATPHALAGYRPPEPQAAPPTLNLIR
jgi:hypothetical protein